MKLIYNIFYLTLFSLFSSFTLSFNKNIKDIKRKSFIKLYNNNFNNFNNFNNYNKDLAEKISFNKLLENIEDHNIDNIYFDNNLRKIYTKSMNDDNTYHYSVSDSNLQLSKDIIELSDRNHIKSVIIDNSFSNPFTYITDIPYIALNLFSTIFIVILISSVIRFFMNQNSMPSITSGFSSLINDNKNKINILKQNNISLSSWAGSKEIFEECTEVVSYLKNNTLYKNIGAEIPKGILLEGPPGTGKTLIAKAIATEAEANFISISASEFIELFVGIGAAKIRTLFKEARDNAPSIIFIDEIDSIGRQRGNNINIGNAGNDEREQTLNQLLAEMDGFTQNENVIVIAATNRKDILDSALLRPGRFDRIINIPLPDKKSRKDILAVYIKNKNVENDINIDFLAELTAGFSGAQIKNLINEAAINAVRLGNTIISQENIEDALEKLIIGIIKKDDTRSIKSLRRVAIHELGHAVLAATFSEYFKLDKVTIKSTYNGVGGYTIFSELPDINESGLYTKNLLKKRLTIALGGKAAEYVFYGEDYVSLGSVKDLKQANSLSQKMISNYGMGKDLKVFYNENINYDINDKYSEKIKEIVDNESLELLNKAYEEAISIILNNKSKINNLSKVLVNNITLSGDYIYENLLY